MNHGRPRPCRPHITAAGLPHRGEVILQRERHLYSLMVNRLLGRGKGSPTGAAESLTMEMLESAFAAPQATILPAAEFLAGRCQPDAPADEERLTVLLRDLLNALPADDLGVWAPAYIEAAMSLALRGEPEPARQALIPLAVDGAARTSRSYLAAFYLAQLGDPSVYPAMLEALRSSSEHTRLMAARHLIAFKPYDGQIVQDKAVDVSAELVQRLRGRSPYVRAEVPHLLAEAGAAGLRELLLPGARRDLKKDVRRAAREVLARLQNA